ncbi:MAG: hypothetical protein ACTSYG_07625 [Candidatus Heimdallarchaeota archaeon]
MVARHWYYWGIKVATLLLFIVSAIFEYALLAVIFGLLVAFDIYKICQVIIKEWLKDRRSKTKMTTKGGIKDE